MIKNKVLTIGFIIVCSIIIAFTYIKYSNGLSAQSLMCHLGYCESDVISRANLVMDAVAKDIISKAHPTTKYESFTFKRVDKTDKEFIAVYEIKYSSFIEGGLYMEVEIVLSKNSLDFIEIRRKSDTSKFPVFELDYSAFKKVIDILGLLK